VIGADGETRTTTTYLARGSIDGLRPYDWYLALIVAGCREHALDAAHVDRLRQAACAPDPVVTRKTYLDALQALKKSGVDDFKTLLAIAAEPVPL
jgi:predicted TIM-barrel enzyme